MADDLTDRELRIVRLIDAGYVRWRIAELEGITEHTARTQIRKLCERYDCRMEHLPAEIGDDVLYPSGRYDNIA